MVLAAARDEKKVKKKKCDLNRVFTVLGNGQNRVCPGVSWIKSGTPVGVFTCRKVRGRLYVRISCRSVWTKPGTKVDKTGYKSGQKRVHGGDNRALLKLRRYIMCVKKKRDKSISEGPYARRRAIYMYVYVYIPGHSRFSPLPYYVSHRASYDALQWKP